MAKIFCRSFCYLIIYCSIFSCGIHKKLQPYDPWVFDNVPNRRLIGFEEYIDKKKNDIENIEMNNNIFGLNFYKQNIDLSGNWGDINYLQGSKGTNLEIKKITNDTFKVVFNSNEKFLCLRTAIFSNNALILNLPLKEENGFAFNKYFLIEYKNEPFLISSASLDKLNLVILKDSKNFGYLDDFFQNVLFNENNKLPQEIKKRNSR